MKKVLKQALSIIMSAAMLMAVPVAAETSEEVERTMETTIYVAAWGDDSNAGTAEAPLKTLEAAKAAVRAVNDGTTDVAVVLRDGEYVLEDTLVFSCEDGGQNGHSVTWRGYEGEEAVISGMTEISGWQLHDAGKNIYKAAVPAGFNTRQLYADGQKARRSRSTVYGDNPYYNLDRTCELGIPARNNREFYFYKNEVADWNNFESVEVHLLTAWTDNILRLKKYDEKNSFKYVNVDNGGGEGTVEAAALKFQEPESTRLFNRPHPDITGSTLGYNSRSYYYFENAYEFIDEDNEWYLDTTENILYFKAPAGTDMNTVRVTAPGLETLVEIAGTKDAIVENLSFENLSFEGSAWLRPSEEGLVGGQTCQYVLTSNLKNEITVYHPASAFFAEYAKGLKVEFCSFSKMGSTAIDFFCGVTDSRIFSCEVYDVAGNGISVAKFTQDENTEFHVAYDPADKSEICSKIRIINNSVHDIGTEYEGAVAIAAGYPDEIIIANNEIYNCPYSGISVGFGWTSADNAMKRNIIYANKIHEIGLVTCDYGAIYTLSKQPQSLCTRNYISNVQRMPWFDYGYAAMYFDEQTEGYVIKENLLHNVGSDAWGGGINFNGCAGKNTTVDNWNIKGDIADSAAREVAEASGVAADKTFEEIEREALELLDDIINPKEPYDESDYYIQKKIEPKAVSATAADNGSSAEYAIDGRADTVYTLSGQTESSMADQYLMIELDGEQDLARIEIDRQYNAGGMTGDNSYWADWCLAVGCELQGSIDGESWETIGVMNTWPDETGEKNKEVFNLAEPKPYKYVRYIRTKYKTGSDYAVWRWRDSDGGNRLNVKDIYFYANVPCEKIEPVTASATACDPNSDPAWASDGNLSTVYTLSGQTADSMGGQYLLLELDGEQLLEKIIIRRQYNAGGMIDNNYWADWCLAVGCELQGSMDGESWETIGVMNTWPDGTGEMSKEVFNLADPKPYKFVRYIRTKFKTGSDYAVWRWSSSDGGNRLNVKEIELYTSQQPAQMKTDILDITVDGDSATVEVYNGEDGDATLYFAAYGDTEQLISVSSAAVGPAKSHFSFVVPEGAKKLSAMLWIKSSITPLCISKSIDLN